MVKPGRTGEQSTTPKEFAETTPVQVGTDLTAWLINAVTRNTEVLGRVQGTLDSLQAQVQRIEEKVDAIKADVKGHGNWIHTMKYVLTGLGVLLTWLVAFVVGPWLRAKFFSGS